MKLFDKLVKKFGSTQKNERVRSHLEFRRMLSMECARADRSKVFFSFIVLDVSTVDNMRFMDDLLTYIDSRIRMSDIVGWLSDKEIGVILPETDFDSAMAIAQTITNHFNHTQQAPPSLVYRYPSSQWPFETDV